MLARVMCCKSNISCVVYPVLSLPSFEAAKYFYINCNDMVSCR